MKLLRGLAAAPFYRSPQKAGPRMTGPRTAGPRMAGPWMAGPRKLGPISGSRRQAVLFAGLLLSLALVSPWASSRTPQAPAAGESFRAATIAVSDGDSFVVRGADGARLRVRLAGIDAPERSQPYSAVARRHLDELLGKRELVLEPIKIDPFGRLVAQVDVDGVDPALAMLEAGLAWHFARYDRDLPPALRVRYADAAALARRERVGLWRDDTPEPPWDFRRRGSR